MLTPGSTTSPSSSQVQFRLRSTAAYRVTATATFTPSPAVPAAGGATVAASDVGVGITTITAQSGVDTPRNDVIASGFAYDPGAVTSANGVTPYGGAAAGRATVQDILNQPGLTILSGNRIAPNENLVGNNFLTVTVRFGIQRQFFTPASLSALITLTIANQ